MKKKKYYVVWVGVDPGIYDSWADCQLQISGYPGAKYKAYDTKEEAVEAYRGDPAEHLEMMRSILRHSLNIQARQSVRPRDYTAIPEIRLDAIAVDGACAGNPGRMEYRAVRVVDGTEVFHIGVQRHLVGTNNIAEYLAMIHLAALLKNAGDATTPIYTDSKNTLAWLRRGRSNTKLERTPNTEAALELLRRADAWLLANGPIPNPILKWNTEEWGEIPADFGRK
ncbi:MAG: ribonuclease H family protein [Muribaculaceae bacterium]|nr:ribonuclease H family protein [Muribaculaceae bacterium]